MNVRNEDDQGEHVRSRHCSSTRDCEFLAFGGGLDGKDGVS